MNKEQLKKLEADLWRAADALRANSDLKASEYSTPVLGLIFLKFADNKYKQYEAQILAEYQQHKGKRTEKPISDIAIEKCGFYLPDQARYDYLLSLPEEKDIAKALKHAMQQIEEHKPELAGVLPEDEYFRLTRSEQNKGMPKQLLKIFADIPANISGDMFGQIYEYFLGEFAMSEGQGGGEFFTPRSVVRLMVEIIEPHGGRVFDPACGSAGMFVQSAQFVEQHRNDAANASSGDIYVCGQEKTLETVKLAKMNLAVNGLRGEIKQANTYYADLRAFVEHKLKLMLEQNATRSDFVQRLQEIIDRYNSGGSSVENSYEELVNFTADIKDEDNRHIREGLTEDELELFDLLKKDGLTKEEEQKVKLAAKSLLHRLLEEQPRVLIQDWFKDNQSQKIARSAVEQVLNRNLPDSYDRILFREKCDNVFELMLDYASQGKKWAAHGAVNL